MALVAGGRVVNELWSELGEDLNDRCDRTSTSFLTECDIASSVVTEIMSWRHTHHILAHRLSFAMRDRGGYMETSSIGGGPGGTPRPSIEGVAGGGGGGADGSGSELFGPSMAGLDGAAGAVGAPPDSVRRRKGGSSPDGIAAGADEEEDSAGGPGGGQIVGTKTGTIHQRHEKHVLIMSMR